MRRSVRPQDLEAIHAIYTHERVSPYLAYDPMPLDAFRPIFEEMLGRQSMFVVERAGEIVGFYEAVRYAGRASHVACLGAVAVRPDLHGTGIATPMLEEAIACLRSAGVRRVELFVESDNPRAIRFYRKLGFEIEGTLRAFYKRDGEDRYVDEHVMGLLLV